MILQAQQASLFLTLKVRPICLNTLQSTINLMVESGNGGFVEVGDWTINCETVGSNVDCLNGA